MPENDDIALDLIEARQRAEALRKALPKVVDPAAIGVLSKAPYKLLVIRETLIWRTEELARNACDALERNDLAVAGILARAVMESAAVAWKLRGLLVRSAALASDTLDAELMRLLLGSRLWDAAPAAVNVLTLIERMEKDVPGVRRAYETLCEVAHPNWMGTAGLYSQADQAQVLTNLGRGLGHSGALPQILHALIGSLDLFEFAYNRISDDLPGYLAGLKKLWPETNSPKGD